MAIIRIKRTTSATLPEGLTFGEFAFVQGTEDGSRNKLYICDSSENLKWIGAEIVNTPNWLGATASTVVPTVAAVQQYVEDAVDGSTSVLEEDIVINIGDGKNFGKYVSGDTIFANNQTALDIIIDALTEYLVLDAATPIVPTHNTTNNPFIVSGQSGSVTWGVTWGYQINTPGYTALGATLEWKRANQGEASWTPITGQIFFDNTSHYWTKGDGFTYGRYQFTVNHTAYDTVGYNFRYKVHDAGGGATSASTTLSPQTFVNPKTTTVNTSTLNINARTPQADSGTLREYGNVGTQLSVQYAVGNNMPTLYHNFSTHGVQWTVGENANENSNTFYSIENTVNQITNVPFSPPTGTPPQVTYTFAPTTPGDPTNRYTKRITWRYRVSYSGENSPIYNGYTFGFQANNVYLRKRIFYGATTSGFFNSASSSWLRSLPYSVFGSTTGVAVSSNNPLTFNLTVNAANDANYKQYVIALPKGLTLNSNANGGPLLPGVIQSTEILAGKPDPTADACQQVTSITTGKDFANNDHDYTYYTWSVGDQYANGTLITIRCHGTVAT